MNTYQIVLKRSAVADMDRLRAYDASAIADAMEKHLLHAPRRESRSGIKRLRGISDPDYRFRAGDYRIFYNVDDHRRQGIVLRVMHKNETRSYYKGLES